MGFGPFVLLQGATVANEAIRVNAVKSVMAEKPAGR